MRKVVSKIKNKIKNIDLKLIYVYKEIFVLFVWISIVEE